MIIDVKSMPSTMMIPKASLMTDVVEVDVIDDVGDESDALSEAI